MIAETLYKIAKDLFNIFTKLDDARLQRTIRVAEYFSNLAQIIEDTSAYLKKGIYPHGECKLLLSHAENMVEAIGDLIGKNEAQKHANEVMKVWKIENMHGELISVPDSVKAEKLKILDEAAGYFRGVAAHLRVSG
ncbi:MAG: hypothetical protein ACFFCD_16750 [Promethearchaeota archaeon]